MEKSKKYGKVKFSTETLKQVLEQCLIDNGISYDRYKVTNQDESWYYDDVNEFYTAYRSNAVIRAWIDISYNNKNYEHLEITYNKSQFTEVKFRSQLRANREKIFEIFDKNYTNALELVAEEDEDEFTNPTIFIGHGRSMQWRDLKDHLSDKHDYEIVAYETGARAGHTIRDILDEMSSESTFAILVMTGEDKDSDGKMNARPNVIHEIGLFQGRLGFSRAIVLLEEGTEEFSNLHGIQQIRYSKNNIKETFGEVLATLKREFE